ncbi:hypothetical protein Tco_0405195 [Tanacetum coccineum]
MYRLIRLCGMRQRLIITDECRSHNWNKLWRFITSSGDDTRHSMLSWGYDDGAWRSVVDGGGLLCSMMGHRGGGEDLVCDDSLLLLRELQSLQRKNLFVVRMEMLFRMLELLEAEQTVERVCREGERHNTHRGDLARWGVKEGEEGRFGGEDLKGGGRVGGAGGFEGGCVLVFGGEAGHNVHVDLGIDVILKIDTAGATASAEINELLQMFIVRAEFKFGLGFFLWNLANAQRNINDPFKLELGDPRTSPCGLARMI